MATTPYQAIYGASHCLVIGINEYQHASPLEHATADATDVADLLRERFGFPASSMQVLLDSNATLRNIQGAMHAIAHQSEPDDRVIVFYAGHGHTVPAYGRDAGFIVPVDGCVKDSSTLLPWDDLYSTSRMMLAKHVLFVMDACYGGLIGTRSVAPGSQRLVRDMLGRFSRQFLTAGKANEPVADGGGPRVGHSLFTGHLLEVLEGGCGASEGLISANLLMAQVYDRVATDPHSLQAPHYGYLSGDGDLFLTVPNLDLGESNARFERDPIIVVSADLTAPEADVSPLSETELAKEYLSDTSQRVRLHDLVLKQLRVAQQRLGTDAFPTEAPSIGAEQFSARLVAYEEAMNNVLNTAVLLGRWAGERQSGSVRQLINTLGGEPETKSGNRLLIALRHYPMLLTLYAGGIAALDDDNYQNLRLFFETRVPSTKGSRNETTSLQATQEAWLDVARSNLFRSIPELERLLTPQSEYLFTRLQPIVEDLLFLGHRYEHLFDRVEMFFALCYCDYTDQYWGQPGRFAWKYTGRFEDEDPFSQLLAEAKLGKDKWLPLVAGLFRGSYDRFKEVSDRFRGGLLEQLNWH